MRSLISGNSHEELAAESTVDVSNNQLKNKVIELITDSIINVMKSDRWLYIIQYNTVQYNIIYYTKNNMNKNIDIKLYNI